MLIGFFTFVIPYEIVDFGRSVQSILHSYGTRDVSRFIKIEHFSRFGSIENESVHMGAIFFRQFVNSFLSVFKIFLVSFWMQNDPLFQIIVYYRFVAVRNVNNVMGGIGAPIRSFPIGYRS